MRPTFKIRAAFPPLRIGDFAGVGVETPRAVTNEDLWLVEGECVEKHRSPGEAARSALAPLTRTSRKNLPASGLGLKDG
jgi:hypothetical protein